MKSSTPKAEKAVENYLNDNQGQGQEEKLEHDAAETLVALGRAQKNAASNRSNNSSRNVERDSDARSPQMTAIAKNKKKVDASSKEANRAELKRKEVSIEQHA